MALSFVSFKGKPKGLLEWTTLNEEKRKFRFCSTGEKWAQTGHSSTLCPQTCYGPFLPPLQLPDSVEGASLPDLQHPCMSPGIFHLLGHLHSPSIEPGVRTFWCAVVSVMLKSSSLTLQLFPTTAEFLICSFIGWVPTRDSYCLGLGSSSCPCGTYNLGELMV